MTTVVAIIAVGAVVAFEIGRIAFGMGYKRGRFDEKFEARK